MARIDEPAYLVRDPVGQRALRSRLSAAVASLHAHADLFSPDEGRARLRPSLSALHASLWSSPYWAETLRSRGIAPTDLRDVNDLRHVPMLDRATLALQYARVPCVHTDPRNELVYVRSSGSTGDPVKVLRDRYDCNHMWAVLQFWCDRLGIRVPPEPRVALLCALPSGLEYAARAPAFHEAFLQRISVMRPEPWQRLSAFGPNIIFSDPAGLHLLAEHGDVAPLLLLSSAQRLPPPLRQRFAAPILDYYALTEVGPVAWACLQCPELFHVLHPDVWVESVDGEIVITRLRPGPFPVLRYRTGDVGEVGFETCSCGVTGWSIRRLQGRAHCTWRTPEGRDVDAWQLAPVFKKYPLQSFTFSHLGAGAFRLALAGGAPDDLLADLRIALNRLGFPWASIEVVDVVVPATAKPAPFQPAPFRVEGAADGAPMGPTPRGSGDSSPEARSG